MAEVQHIQCDKCGTTTQYVWVKSIKYICSNCRHEIDFLSAIFDGRVKNTNGFVENKPKKKKGK